MNFDLILGDDENNYTTMSCSIFQPEFEVGYNTIPTMIEFNLYQIHKKIDRCREVVDELNKLIDEWNDNDIGVSWYGRLYISNNECLSMEIPALILALKTNMWSNMGIKMLLDNNSYDAEYTEQTVIIYKKLHVLRDVTIDITSNKNSQYFNIKFGDEFKLFNDDDYAKFSFARNPGEIFLAPTAIAYDYDDLIIEKNNKTERIPTEWGQDASIQRDLGQQVCYNGNLIFWCGESRTHEQTVNAINDSIDTHWKVDKYNKTDLSNEHNLLTLGMIKVGSFDIVPEIQYNKVIDYVSK